jgi:zinc protease
MRILATMLLLNLVSAAPDLAAQTRVPPLQYRARTLSNGLKVYSLQDRSAPTVAIQVWYKVGSKDDPVRRSGFAHLFEHMMFKSTQNMKSEMMDRLTEDVGGANNAGTADDYTLYYEVVPSNYLETLLWAEADRMHALNVNEENFDSERDVVKEEFRQRILAPPYGKLGYAIETQSYEQHPYKRPGIGSIEDLDAATIADVRAFYGTFYRPDNATLVVVGDFDDAQLDAWADKYFAGIPKPAAPIPRVTVKEPARSAQKRVLERGANVPLPAVAITYLTESDLSDDAPALDIAAVILSAGESSRLYQSLVYRQRVAAQASAGSDLREDNGLFVLRGIAASGSTVDQVEKALGEEIEKMRSQPVTDAELSKAKNLAVTGELRSRESNEGKAMAIGAAVTLGDPERVNRNMQRLQAVTAADVQRVARKYFNTNNSVVIHYVPESPNAPKTDSDNPGVRE